MVFGGRPVTAAIYPGRIPMNIVMYLLGGLLLLVAAYCVVVFIALQRSKRPQHCRNCDEDTLEYIGFFTEPFDGQSQESFSPRAYYRCNQCQLTAKLERGEWYDVPSEEVQQAADSAAELDH